MTLSLHPDLHRLLDVYRAQRSFNAADWVEKKLAAAAEHFTRCGLTGAVVSVSGGIDSAVVTGLCRRLLDMGVLKRVLLLTQPIHSTPSITARAYEVGTAFNLPVLTIDQTAIYDQLRALCDTEAGFTSGSFASGQLRSYMRTPPAYYMAQLLGQDGNPAVVMGTGNYDEDGYLRYFCKAGDGVVDVALISDLHKSEVFAVAREIGVPMSIVCAPPSADLWAGQTDEDEIGATYDFVEFWTGYWLQLSDAERLQTLENLSEDARVQLEQWGQKIETIHRRNAHKVNFPYCINVLSMPEY